MIKREKTKTTRRDSDGDLIRTYKGFAISDSTNGFAIFTSERFTIGETAGVKIRTVAKLKDAKALIDSGELDESRGYNSVKALRCDWTGSYIGDADTFMMFYRVAGDLWVSINGKKKFAVLNAVEINGDVIWTLAPNHDYIRATVVYRSV